MLAASSLCEKDSGIDHFLFGSRVQMIPQNPTAEGQI